MSSLSGLGFSGDLTVIFPVYEYPQHVTGRSRLATEQGVPAWHETYYSVREAAYEVVFVYFIGQSLGMGV
jgi:hypothetical protein